MATLEEQLFERHLGKSILLDSNLLLVFITGAFDLRLLATFKRVSAYSIKDYDLLVRLLNSFSVLLTTPHILTEVSNLANSLPERVKPEWFRSFALLLRSEHHRPGMREHWLPAAKLASTPEFVTFGLSDAGLIALAAEALMVTEDYRLFGAMRKLGVPALNFNDLRALLKFI